MPTKVLSTEFRGKDGGIINLMKEAGASADQLKKKMQDLQQAGNKPAEASGGGGGVLKDLKAGLGAKSPLGQLGKTLKGGGAVLGLTLIAGELAKAAKNAKELTDQFKAGKISGGEMAEGLAKGLPVIGGFISAGRDIKELLASFDGLANSGFGKLIGLDDLNYAQKINKELAVTKAVDDFIGGSLEKQKTLLKQIAEERAHIAVEAVKVGLQGDAAKKYELEQQAAQRLAEVDKKRQDALAEADKRRGDAMQKVRDDKDMSPAMAYKIEQNIQKQANAEKKKINADFDGEQSDTEKLNAAERVQAAKDHGQKMADAKAQSAKEIGDIQADARARQLKEMGDSLGAELLMIARSGQDKKDAIAKALKDQSAGASPQDVAAFTQEAKEKSAAIDADTVAQTRLARKHQQEAAVKTLQEGQLDVLREQANAGDDFAAAELKRLEAAKANNDEQRKLLDLLEQQLTPAERKAALAELGAVRAADKGRVARDLENQRGDALKAQAENGTPEEKREAEKQLEIIKLKKQYNEEAAKTAAIMNDPKSTQADKAAAIDNLKAYAATLGKQFDKDLGLDKAIERKRTSDGEERGLLITGVAASARAKKDPQEQIAKNSDEAVKLQKVANASFDQFVQWTKQQQQNNPTVVFGVTDD